MKLSAKLVSGFVLMIVMMAILAIISTTRMGFLSDKMNGVVQVRMPQLYAFYSIMRDYDVIARSTRNIALATDEGVKQKQREAFSKAKADLTDTLNTLEKSLTTAKGKELLVTLKESLTNVTQLSEKAVSLDDAKKHQEMAGVIINEILAPQAKMLESLEAFASLGKELAIKEGEASAQSASSGKALLMVFGAVASALGLFMAFFITRSIIKPINRVVAGVTEGADQVASASSQVSVSGQKLAEGASQQAAAIEETSASIEEMSSMTQNNANNARESSQLMTEASQTVLQAGRSMEMLTASMGEISKASEETFKIIKTIDEIAFQTNLLALNAAVEAARAGEAGAGFAVVADEVRNLAMRAAEAAKDTADLIEGTVKKVKEGSEIVKKTEGEFRLVAGSVEKSSQLVGEISAASLEQAQGVEQINKAVREMERVVQQNVSNAEETASASEEMNAQANQMKEFVEELTFLVNGSKANGAAENGALGKRTQRKDEEIPSKVSAVTERAIIHRARTGNGNGPNQSSAGRTGQEKLILHDQAEFSDF